MDAKEHIKQIAESDLEAFIKLVAPHRLLGHIHQELIRWWTREGAKSHQLVLLPRDHMKSALVAYRVAWEITKNPATTVLYISSTAGLAEKQLKFIKDILTSKKYRQYWPEMIHEDEGKREKWTQSEIAVDHFKRRDLGIRDSTVFTGGLTTSLTGFHCAIAVLDDVVVQENAYSDEGREKVRLQYSLLASIEGANAQEWVVGTRYHPMDLYADMITMKREVFDDKGQLIDEENVYEVFHRQVEDQGDGTGEYLWPRQYSTRNGEWYGFDQNILATKKAKYLDKTQFYAQYYNDPNKYENALIDPNKFQYYDRAHVLMRDSRWYVRGKKVNVFASMDFAFSIGTRSDFCVIAVIGVDSTGSVYVLDIDRFKTEKISEMFDHIRQSYVKWGFRKIRMEMTQAQSVLVRELRDQYIRPHGLNFSIDEYYPSTKEGAKEERVMSVLQPRYENLAIWHYKGGNCQVLEEEVKMRHPPHDDCKDALASAIEISVPPVDSGKASRTEGNVIFSNRFGGVSHLRTGNGI